MNYKEVHLAAVKDWGYPPLLLKHISETKNVAPSNVFSILDIGCGTGTYTRALARTFKALVIGIDLDPVKLESIDTVKVDLNVDTYSHKYFSCEFIFSKSVLEHLTPQGQANFCKTIKSNLATGGTAVVMVPDWSTGYKTFYDDYTHISPFTARSLKDLFAANGLDATVELFWQSPFAWKHPKLWAVARRFWWLVRDPDLKQRMREAALLATIKNP